MKSSSFWTLRVHSRSLGVDAGEFTMNFPSDPPLVIIVEKHRWTATHGGNRCHDASLQNVTVGLGRGLPGSTWHGYALLQRGHWLSPSRPDKRGALDSGGGISREQVYALVGHKHWENPWLGWRRQWWFGRPREVRRQGRIRIFSEGGGHGFTSAGVYGGVLGMIGLVNSEIR